MRAVAIVVLLVACYAPTPPDGAPCNTASLCPSPLTCDRGICRAQPGDNPDAAMDGPIVTPDAAAPACAPQVVLPAFPSPTVNTVLSTAADDGTPTLTADRLELYIKSDRAGGAGGTDIWRSVRATITSPWGAPSNVTELNSAGEDVSPEVAPDGLTIWLSSDRPGGQGRLDIWVATRASRTAAWSAPVRVPELSSSADDEGIAVLPSALVAYVHSDRGGATVLSIYRATRSSPQDPWSTPVAPSGLSVDSNDENPWVSADDCTMYFQSDRPGGKGSADIWMTTRSMPTAAFGTPIPISPLNAITYDADPWLSADQRFVMIVGDRGAVGGFDIYEATR